MYVYVTKKGSLDIIFDEKDKCPRCEHISYCRFLKAIIDEEVVPRYEIITVDNCLQFERKRNCFIQKFKDVLNRV